MKKMLFFYVFLGLSVLIVLDYSITVCTYLVSVYLLLSVLFFLYKKNVNMPILWSFFYIWGIVILYICFGKIHISNADGKITVYSPLYTRTLLVDAENADTIILCDGIECFYGQFAPKQSEFYFLIKDDTLHVFNRMREVMASKDLTLDKRFSHGIAIDVLHAADNNVYSLYGEVLDAGWSPRIIDTTPFDPNM